VRVRAAHLDVCVFSFLSQFSIWSLGFRVKNNSQILFLIYYFLKTNQELAKPPNAIAGIMFGMLCLLFFSKKNQ